MSRRIPSRLQSIHDLHRRLNQMFVPEVVNGFLLNLETTLSDAYCRASNQAFSPAKLKSCLHPIRENIHQARSGLEPLPSQERLSLYALLVQGERLVMLIARYQEREKAATTPINARFI